MTSVDSSSGTTSAGVTSAGNTSAGKTSESASIHNLYRHTQPIQAYTTYSGIHILCRHTHPLQAYTTSAGINTVGKFTFIIIILCPTFICTYMRKFYQTYCTYFYCKWLCLAMYITVGQKFSSSIFAVIAELTPIVSSKTAYSSVL